MDFPKRVYTSDEVARAKDLVDKGYKHRLRAKGSPEFKQKARQAFQLVKTAGYYDFLRTYIRSVVEIDGLTQLREADVSVWANRYTVENSVDGASVLVQKANHMKEYLEGKLYYGGAAERRSGQKRIEFLEALKKRSKEKAVVEECKRLLKLWSESSLVY